MRNTEQRLNEKVRNESDKDISKMISQKIALKQHRRMRKRSKRYYAI